MSLRIAGVLRTKVRAPWCDLPLGCDTASVSWCARGRMRVQTRLVSVGENLCNSCRMTFAQAKARHTELAQEIRRHDQAYYVEAKPLISDFEYDQLYRELVELEKQFPNLVTPESPTQRVGGAPTAGFKRVRHLQPMLSLEKIEAAEHPDKDAEPDASKRNRLQDENTLQSLLGWDTTIRKHLKRDSVDYIMEPKVDGVSISVHYRRGKFALSVTRGDGQYGDDIST